MLDSRFCKEIPFSEIENVSIGHAEDKEHATGVSVLVFDRFTPTGLDVRGGSPASKEAMLLEATSSGEGINGIVLAGGSAFGLDSATGVMKYLEEKKIGFDVGNAVVPIVCGSAIFDLHIVSANVRPDAAMGYKACLDSENKRSDSGCIGGGCGATVGKYNGDKTSMKSGFGCYAVQIGDLKIGAAVVLNALGDIFDVTTGRQIAGMLNEDCTEFLNTMSVFANTASESRNVFTNNTTIGAVVTNAKFDKVKMKRVALTAHDGYARAINPTHTTADGDSIYACSVGDVEADLDAVCAISAEVMAMALRNAALGAEPMYGLKCAKDFINK